MVLNKTITCYLDTNYLKTYKHKSVIYLGILKYGLSVFRLEILEHCSKKEVTLREQFYLDTLKPTYNILKFAGSCLGFKHYYCTIVQMEERNKNNNHFLAPRTLAGVLGCGASRKHSKESKLKMSLSSRLSSPSVYLKG
jgi:group I intron endonuclease